jgi:hypothetical protein
VIGPLRKDFRRLSHFSTFQAAINPAFAFRRRATKPKPAKPISTPPVAA